MAALQVLNNNLTATIGVTDPNVHTALNGQGLLAITGFETLEERNIDSICANIRKPGGMIQIVNPAHDPNNVRQGIPPVLNVPNPGLSVGHIVVKRFKMLWYYISHLKRVQRAFDPAVSTLIRLTEVYRLKEIEEEDDNNVPYPEKLTTIDHICRAIENIDAWLWQKFGSLGALLAYITRLVVVPPPKAQDLAFGLPTYNNEMVWRAPHST
jgi:hypothetical protein